MTEFWKSLSIALATAIVTSLITVIAPAYFSRNGDSNIQARLLWAKPDFAEVPLSEEVTAGIQKIFAPLLGKSEVDKLVGKFRYISRIGFLHMDIENSGNEKSANLEIAIDNAIIGFISILEGQNVRTSKIDVSSSSYASIGSLNPGQIASVFVVSEEFYDLEQTVRLLHGGQLINIEPLALSERYQTFGIMPWMLDNLPWSELILIVSTLSLVFLIALLFISIISNLNVNIRLRLTTDQEMKNLFSFVSYVIEKHPERAPAKSRINVNETERS